MDLTRAFVASVSLVVIGAAISGAAGCADEGVTHIAYQDKRTGDAGSRDARAPSNDDDDDDDDEDDTDNPATADAGADDEEDTFAPCPTGFMCMDFTAALRSRGISGTIVDEDGRPLPATCSTGALQDCDPDDPKGSCPGMTDPFCATLTISVSPTPYSQCAQRCTP